MAETLREVIEAFNRGDIDLATMYAGIDAARKAGEELTCRQLANLLGGVVHYAQALKHDLIGRPWVDEKKPGVRDLDLPASLEGALYDVINAIERARDLLMLSAIATEERMKLLPDVEREISTSYPPNGSKWHRLGQGTWRADVDIEFGAIVMRDCDSETSYRMSSAEWDALTKAKLWTPVE